MSDSSIRTYTCKVAEENGDAVLVFDPQMLEDLGWVEGDNIVWDIRPDAVVVRKSND
jgi:formylmethanofuran dehydrogenase subunit D